MRRMTLLLIGLISLLCSVSPLYAADAKHPKVKIQTSMGDIVLELDAEKAPKTTANFLDYAKIGFYDGTIFHRVIDNFMIQGGGFTRALQRKDPKSPVQNEADNGLKNVRGTIAMARTNDPHSASSQFFINVVDNAFLNHRNKTAQGWGYTVFGKVIEGMDVVDKIRRVTTGSRGPFRSDVPQIDVVIEKAEVL